MVIPSTFYFPVIFLVITCNYFCLFCRLCARKCPMCVFMNICVHVVVDELMHHPMRMHKLMNVLTMVDMDYFIWL